MEQTSQFFGGDAADLGTVHRLAPTNFKEFVDQLLNVAVPLNLTRKEFSALPKEDRQRVKRVPYVVPCIFADSPSRRVYENATGVALVCIDIDDPGQAAPYVNNPEVIAGQLTPFNFAVHTTASSTPEKPRMRVFVQAASLPLDRYHDAVRDIAGRIGLPNVNKESLVAVQPMYRPVLFRDEATHPLIISETGGRAYTLRDLEATDAAPSPAQTQRANSNGGGVDSVFDALEYLRPPVSSITLADAKAALRFLDPDCTYPEWLEVAAALRHQFSGEEESDAYEVFDTWSEGGTKYTSGEDTAAKWKSLRPNPAGRVPITIRTLLQRAVVGGWDSGRVKAKCYASTLAWIKEHAGEDASGLLQSGVKQVAATPLLTSSEEEGLLQELAHALKSSNMKVSLTSLRKDLRRMRQAARVKDKDKNRIPEWAKGMCYVSHTNIFLRPSVSEQLSPESLDRNYGNNLLPSEEELRESGDSSMCARGRPTIRPQDYLLNIVGIPRAYDTLYEPQQFNDTFIVKGGKVYVNLYSRTHPEPDVLRMAEAGEIFLEHIRNLIAEPEYATLLVDFMAYIVQNPGAKIRWAVLLQGAQGCGKTALSEVMKAVVGGEHVMQVDNEAIRGQWNDWAYGHQLVVLEEVRVAGQNRHDIMNRLKPLISNDQVCINQRHRDSRNVDNIANYMLFTNHHDALALSSGDRRYFVLKSRMQTRESVEALGPQYFSRLFAMLRDNAAGLRAWFEHYQISPGFCPDGHAPDTTYRREMVTEASGDLSVAMHEVIEDSVHPLVASDLLSSTVLTQLILERGEGVACSSQQLARLLREEGWLRVGRNRIGDSRHQIWVNAGAGIEVADAYRLICKRAEVEIPIEDLI